MNFYVENTESAGASSQKVLYPTPGVSSLGTAVSGPGSAHIYHGGREFAIIGPTFYEIDRYGALTSFGTVSVDSNPGTISSNGDGGGQLFITSGGNGYLFDLTTDTFSTIAALAGKATMGDMLDGYFLCLDGNSSTVYISDLLDGSTWDPTNYFQRSIAADPWVSMKVANRYIYLFGTETSEVWYDAGSFPIPFQPHPSGLMQYGCGAPFSPEVIKGTVIWLAQTVNGNGSVMRVSGFQPEEVSNNALQHNLNEYTTLADAVGDTYDDLGHTFYILTFRTADHTWVYDDDTGVWCERGTWIEEDSDYTAWRPLYHAFAFNQHRMLDIESGDVYQMSSSFYSDVDGRVIRRMRRSPALVRDNSRLFYNWFELMLEPGVIEVEDSDTGEMRAPEVMLRFSNDGGKTWSTEQVRTAGDLGDYGHRVRWNRLGSGRKRVFEVSVSDAAPWRFVDAFLGMGKSADVANG